MRSSRTRLLKCEEEKRGLQFLNPLCRRRGQPSAGAGLEPVPDVGVSQARGDAWRRIPIPAMPRERGRRWMVLAGTSANTLKASPRLLVGRVVMAVTRTTNRQQDRQNGKEAKATIGEPNGCSTQHAVQYTGHSTVPSASDEGMAAFNVQPVPSLRPPSSTGSL